MSRAGLSAAELDHAQQLLAELAIALSITSVSSSKQLDVSATSRAHSAPLLTVEDACRRLSISKWSLYRLIREKQLESIKIGARRFISEEAIDLFLAQLRTKAGVRS